MKGFSQKVIDLGYEHLSVPKDKLTLHTSWEDIKTYTFGTGVAKHYFCGTCGITPFYIPRSNPDGYSVMRLPWANDADQLPMSAV
jgi:hypothetical protein